MLAPASSSPVRQTWPSAAPDPQLPVQEWQKPDAVPVEQAALEQLTKGAAAWQAMLSQHRAHAPAASPRAPRASRPAPLKAATSTPLQPGHQGPMQSKAEPRFGGSSQQAPRSAAAAPQGLPGSKHSGQQAAEDASPGVVKLPIRVQARHPG